MSQSNMNGFINDEQDEKFTKVFAESMTASGYLESQLPKNGDRLFFSGHGHDQWVEIVNKDGRLWIEIGEGAA